MNIKEYVKIQSKECTNIILKNIFLDLNDMFNYTPKTYNAFTPSSYKKEYSSKKAEDNIQNKKIYILPDYNEALKTQTTANMKTGYKSAISEDIVADNGDIYDFVALCMQYKFYKFKENYYVRLEGSNVVSIINEHNYDRFKSILKNLEK